MKKIISIGLIICLLFTITACGSIKVINGKEIESIGLINIWVNDKSILPIKEPGIKYKIMWENVIIGVILCETLIFPIYIFGFALLKPVDSLVIEPKPINS